MRQHVNLMIYLNVGLRVLLFFISSTRMSYADLIKGLRIQEIEIQKSNHKKYLEAVQKWRKLRTDHAVKSFISKLRSQEFRKPKEMMDILGEIKQNKADCFSNISKKILSLRNLLPPTMSVERAEDWFKECSLILNGWKEIRSSCLDR